MTEQFHRGHEFDRAKIDEGKRTVELSFSSEEPCERYGENEVLSHEKGDYDFSRINSGNHPLLVGHDESDPRSQIGVVESAWVQDKKGRAVVRFGDSPLASEIFRDVVDGIRRCISVGYSRTKAVSSSEGPDGMVTTRYAWMPTHISVVSVPADTTVGIGRSNRSMRTLSLQTQLDRALSGSRKRTGGLSRERLTRYSLARRILSRENEPDERDDVRESVQRIAGEPISDFVPWEALHTGTRDMQATVFGAGGAAVVTDLAPVVEVLFNHSCVMRYCADHVFDGLTGNFLAPRITAAILPAMVSEIQAAQLQTPTFDNQVLKPARLTVAVKVSRQLEIQNPQTERIIRLHIARAFATTMDRQFLFGAGQNNEISGILLHDDVQEYQWGGAATWADILTAESLIGAASADNPDGSGLGWILSNKTRQKWKAAQKIVGSNFPSFLMESDQSVNGSPALITLNLADTDRSVLGNFDHAFPLIWGDGFDMIRDPFSQATTGEVRIVCHCWFNLFIAHGQAFACSQDSAAQ